MAFNDMTATIGLDSKPFDAGLKNVERGAKAFATGLKGFFGRFFGMGGVGGLLGGAALGAAVRHVTNMAGEIKDQADRLDMTTDKVQGLRKAFQETGGAADDAVTAVEKLAMARDAALGDLQSKEAAAFGALGIDRESLKLQDNFELMRQIGEQLKGSVRSEQQLVALADLFGTKLAGKAGAALREMDEIYARAAANGEFMLESTIAALDAFGKAEELLRERTLSRLGDKGSDAMSNLALYGSGIARGLSKEQEAVSNGSFGFNPVRFFRNLTKGVDDEINQFAEDLAKEVEAQNKAADSAESVRRALRERRAKEGDAKAQADLESRFADKTKAEIFRPPSDALSAIGGSTAGTRLGSYHTQVNTGFKNLERQLERLNRAAETSGIKVVPAERP